MRGTIERFAGSGGSLIGGERGIPPVVMPVVKAAPLGIKPQEPSLGAGIPPVQASLPRTPRFEARGRSWKINLAAKPEPPKGIPDDVPKLFEEKGIELGAGLRDLVSRMFAGKIISQTAIENLMEDHGFKGRHDVLQALLDIASRIRTDQ